MSQRLAELQRQRALLQEHLAWIEREIAAETSGATEPTPLSPASPPAEAGSSAPTLSSPAPLVPATKSGAIPAMATTVATAADATIETTVNVIAPGPLAAAPHAGAPPVRGAEDILDQYRTAPDALRNDIRKGCFLYFALAFALLGIGVTALYVLFRL